MPAERGVASLAHRAFLFSSIFLQTMMNPIRFTLRRAIAATAFLAALGAAAVLRRRRWARCSQP
jgi:hypothetical protein